MLYRLIQWPESQALMEKRWFHMCILAQDIEGHDEVGSSAYFVPENALKATLIMSTISSFEPASMFLNSLENFLNDGLPEEEVEEHIFNNPPVAALEILHPSDDLRKHAIFDKVFEWVKRAVV